MNNEKTITICGKEVKMRYCAATENGFELMSNKKISVFSPLFGKDDKGEDIVIEPAKATTQDFLYLAVAAIIAAYERIGEESPIDAKEIIYDAKPAEIMELVRTIIEIRAAWYEVPLVLKEQIEKDQADQKEEEQQKNA